MIGYYVHHHGSGHLARARSIAAALPDDVVGLSTLAPPEDVAFSGWVRLTPDDADATPLDVTANGMLHWAPLGAPAASARVAELTGWVARARPRAVVVDVSVEAAVAVRLAGARLVVVAQPGRRDDAAHQLAYQLADLVVAPWPQEVYDPSWLHPHHAKTTYVGAVSRFDGRTPQPYGAGGPVVVLQGTGGRWTHAETGPLAPGDVWESLQQASVVVCHAGQNLLAEVAAARRPAVVIAQDRPFDEQRETAAALERAGLAVVAPATGSFDLDALVALARGRGPGDWSRWSSGAGATRAAQAVGAVADRGLVSAA